MSPKMIPFTSLEDGALWAPTQQQILDARLTSFARAAIKKNSLNINTWPDFYRWSVTAVDDFWCAVWDFFQILAAQRGAVVTEKTEHPFIVRWFPGARLNYAQNLLYLADRPEGARALFFLSETGESVELSWGALREQVRVCAQAMQRAGITVGDRVAAFVPARPEAVVAFLAASSLGAVWCACSPDFGVSAALDRLAQVAPRLILLCDGYTYKGKTHDCSEKNQQLLDGLSSVKTAVLVRTGEGKKKSSAVSVDQVLDWSDWMTPVSNQPIIFEQFSFNHPLCIVFTSGTTGQPKCIVHGAGGVLLQHLKEHALHGDIGPGDHFFYYTTCAWMMWHWLVSGLACGAAVHFYDGYPLANEGRVIFDLITQQKLTHVGLSAEWIHQCMTHSIQPLKKKHRLSTVRFIFSTGSSLSADGFRYVYRHFKKDVCLGSISGGTDILSCFVLSNPILPVFAGEIQSPGLGMSVQVFDQSGLPCTGVSGELVCTRPFPSMPIGFWHDDGDVRYNQAYFDRCPSVWHHGDFCEKTERGTFVMKGRSDSVLKPGGARIGTAEIYAPLRMLPFVDSAVAIGQRWGSGERIVLFVQLADGVAQDDRWVDEIKKHLSQQASPRHVPAKVLFVPQVPRVRNQKLAEAAVRAVVDGRTVPNLDSLDDPSVLDFFKDRDELQVD